jgi:hypothetical protein
MTGIRQGWVTAFVALIAGVQKDAIVANCPYFWEEKRRHPPSYHLT